MPAKRSCRRIFCFLVSLLILCICFPGVCADVIAESGAKNMSNKNESRLQSAGRSSTETPCIVETIYPADDVVIADIIATDSPYSADNTGTSDSTAAIQSAIDRCYEAGGGTVFLPAGTYLVTGNITVREYVTLRGDWQDPDKGNSYGTIIKAAVTSTAEDLPALFTVLGSAGVMGLTVYYPDQDIEQVKPYPYTFYVPGEMLQSIINCTVINGYKGIGACFGEGGHEMMTIDNVKGTFLCCGAEAYNQSDVGTWKNLTLSNKYWAEAGAGIKRPPRSEIDAYTRENATGLILGDLEWTQFANINIADYKYGAHIVKGKRIEFAGALYNVNIARCDVGLLVDAIDTRWGMVVAGSSIYGSKHSVINNTFGVVKMTGTRLAGGIKTGKVLFRDFNHFIAAVKTFFKYGIATNRKYIIDYTDLSGIKADYNTVPCKPAEFLFIADADRTGTADATAEIQEKLDLAASTGGIVYLPAGKYRMDGSVTVPPGVELRGSSSVATRDQGSSRGTVIFAYYGLNPAKPETDAALITLGANAGVRGIRFIYPNNSCVVPGALGTVRPCTYTIRGTGEGVYAINLAIAASYNGIDFRGCDNHRIKKVVTCCYNNAIFAGNCSGGVMEGCLQNGTVMSRNGFNLPNWIDEGSQLFPYLFNAVTRVKTEYIKISNARNETIYNCFSYGVKTFINNTDSTNLIVFNIGADNIGGTMFITEGGSACVINMMRYNGNSFANDGTALRMFNRLTIDDRTEKTVRQPE